MNKRGQFYLIAALVIVGVVAGLATVYNSAKSQEENVAVYDLSDEIIFEGSQVLTSGLFNAASETEMTENLINLTDYYAGTNSGSELLVLYGNGTILNYVVYNNSIVGSISLGGTIGVPISMSQTSRITKTIGLLTVTNSQVEIFLSNNVKYTFRIKPGYQFYIILKRQEGSETFVAIPDPATQPEITDPIIESCNELFTVCNNICTNFPFVDCQSICQEIRQFCISSGCTWQTIQPCINMQYCDSASNCEEEITQCRVQLENNC